MKRKSLYIGVTALICLGLLELGFYFLSFFVDQECYYHLPTFKQFAAYLHGPYANPAYRNLGWGPDKKGYRFAPAGQSMKEPFISLYGDSFTFAMDVADEETWGNVLTQLTGKRVDNYGVGGYGTDQAYLRFLHNDTDHAQVVILNHLSENIVRNINQDRSMIYPVDASYRICLKPRFVIDKNGKLQYLKSPGLTESDYGEYVAHPEKFLTAEGFLPNHGFYTLKRLQFPYLWSVPNIYTSKRVMYAKLRRRLSSWFDVQLAPWYASLYDPKEPSQALQVTREIMVNFVQAARQRGQVPLLLVTPTVEDFRYFRRYHRWIFTPLLDALRLKGYYAYNLGPLLLKKLEPDEKLRDYFCSNVNGGHYSVKGNRILAQVVFEILNREGILGEPRGLN